MAAIRASFLAKARTCLTGAVVFTPCPSPPAPVGAAQGRGGRLRNRDC
jgi:hypothetical protein